MPQRLPCERQRRVAQALVMTSAIRELHNVSYKAVWALVES